MQASELRRQCGHLPHLPHHPRREAGRVARPRQHPRPLQGGADLHITTPTQTESAW